MGANTYLCNKRLLLEKKARPFLRMQHKIGGLRQAKSHKYMILINRCLHYKQ